jgi:hypothetical protein
MFILVILVYIIQKTIVHFQILPGGGLYGKKDSQKYQRVGV